jgi:hypothetical protein
VNVAQQKQVESHSSVNNNSALARRRGQCVRSCCVGVSELVWAGT